MSSKRDYYEALGVGRSAHAEEIKKAYRQPARKYHPAVNNDLHHDLEIKFEEGNLKSTLLEKLLFSERAREEAEVREKADIEAGEVTEVFQSYGLTAEESKPIVDALRKRPQAWVDFMMRFELGLEKPDPG